MTMLGFRLRSMNSRPGLLVAPILLALLGSAHAQQNCSCGSGQRVAPDTKIAALLGGKTVCASLSATEQWQEYHVGNSTAGGDLIDYKKGPSDAVDPTEKVGTWSTTGTLCSPMGSPRLEAGGPG